MGNTIVVELRHNGIKDDPVSVVIDDLNHILVRLSRELDMDILSISHSPYSMPLVGSRNPVWMYSSTAVFVRNGQTAKSIAAHLGQNDLWTAFEDDGKVSVEIEKFRRGVGSRR